MWKNIDTTTAIADLLNSFGGFHDSCIKEVIYISGSYVTPQLSMHAINDLRKLSIIVQRQCKSPTTIELSFLGLIKLSLEPNSPSYTSELLGATMYFDNDQIVFSDSETSKAGDEQYKNLYVCAKKARWRVAAEEDPEGRLTGDKGTVRNH